MLTIHVGSCANNQSVVLHCACQVTQDAPDKAPLELSFQEHYGAMQRHFWFGDGFMMVGFKSGQVVVVSSHRCVVAAAHSIPCNAVTMPAGWTPSNVM